MRSLRSPLPISFCAPPLFLWFALHAFCISLRRAASTFMACALLACASGRIFGLPPPCRLGKWVMRAAESVLLICCPPAPLAPKRVDAQIGRVQLDFFQFIGFGHHRHGAGRSVDAALAFGGQHRAARGRRRFKILSLLLRRPADNAGNHCFIAAQIAFVGRHDFICQRLRSAKRRCIAQQITGKQGRFVAAGAGAHCDT